MVLNSIRTPQTSGSGVFPALVLVQGNEQRNIVLNRTPFSVGRKVDKDLVIADPRAFSGKSSSATIGSNLARATRRMPFSIPPMALRTRRASS
jgi:hypothetical protein